MKKILLCIILTLFLVAPVFAKPEINTLTKKVASSSDYDTGVTDTTISQNVGRIIKGTLTLVGTVFLVLTVYAGFLWMTASGDDTKVEKATGIIRSSVIGLIIVVAAYSITTFVVGSAFKASTPAPAVGASQTSKSSGSAWTDFWSGVGKGIEDVNK